MKNNLFRFYFLYFLNFLSELTENVKPSSGIQTLEMDAVPVLDITDPGIDEFVEFDPDETEFVYDTQPSYHEIFMKYNLTHNEISLFNIWYTIHKFHHYMVHSPNIQTIDREIFLQNIKIYELLCDKLDIFASIKDNLYTTLQEITLTSMDCFDNFYFDIFLTEFEKHRTIFNKQVQIVNHYHRVSKHPPQVFTEEYPIFQKQKRIMAALMSFLKDEMLPRSCNKIIRKIQKLRELFILIIETSPIDADKLKTAGTSAFNSIITLVLDLKGMLLGRQLLNMSLQFIPQPKIDAQKRSFIKKDEIFKQQVELEKNYIELAESRGTERIAQQNSEDLKISENLFNQILTLDKNSELIQRAVEMLKQGIENQDIKPDISKNSFLEVLDSLRKFLKKINCIMPEIELYEIKIALGLASATLTQEKSEIIHKFISSIDQFYGPITKVSQLANIQSNFKLIKEIDECNELCESFEKVFIPFQRIIEVIELTNDLISRKLTGIKYTPLALDFDNAENLTIPAEFREKFNSLCQFLHENNIDISKNQNFEFENLTIPNIYPILKDLNVLLSKLPFTPEFEFAHKFVENLFDTQKNFKYFFQIEMDFIRASKSTSIPNIDKIQNDLKLIRCLDSIYFMLDKVRTISYEIAVQNTYLRLGYIVNDQCDHLKNVSLIKPLNPKHLQDIIYKQSLLKLIFLMKIYWPTLLELEDLNQTRHLFRLLVNCLQDKQFETLLPLYEYFNSKNSEDIPQSENIMELCLNLLMISTRTNYEYGWINQKYAKPTIHDLLEYFYNFKIIENIDMIFDPLDEFIVNLNSPKLYNKFTSLKYGSSSSQSLIELALYVISEPNLTYDIKKFVETLSRVAIFLSNIEGLDFAASLVVRQIQSDFIKPYAVASFNLTRFSFMFSDLLFYLNTAGIISSLESYKAIQMGIQLKNIHPPNLVLGTEVKDILQNIKNAANFMSNFCTKDNTAIQRMFDALKTAINFTISNSEVPLCFLSSIQEKLFSGENVTDDCAILLTYFDKNDANYSHIQAYANCIKAIQSVLIIIDQLDNFDMNLGYWRYELYDIPVPVNPKRQNPKINRQSIAAPKYWAPITLLEIDDQRRLIDSFEKEQEERDNIIPQIKEYDEIVQKQKEIEKEFIDTQLNRIFLVDSMKMQTIKTENISKLENHQTLSNSLEYHNQERKLLTDHLMLSECMRNYIERDFSKSTKQIHENRILTNPIDANASSQCSECEREECHDEPHENSVLNEELTSFLGQLAVQPDSV